MYQKIALKKLKSIVVRPSMVEVDSPLSECAKNPHLMTLIANLWSLGYALSEDALQKLQGQSDVQLEAIWADYSPIIKNMLGADVKYSPMYPNFPQQVIETSKAELIFNALVHYWTGVRDFGFVVKNRPDLNWLDRVSTRTLGVCSYADVVGVIDSIARSNSSLSSENKEILEFGLKNHLIGPYTTLDIPQKETMAIIGAHMLTNRQDISGFVKTATDVLRIAVHLSGGDVSLGQKTKFVSLPKRQRKALTKALEKVASAEDFKRHEGMWVKLAHSLHVGDFSSKVYNMIKPFRTNENVETFNTFVEQNLASNKIKKAVGLLSTRPGDFARRLDTILRKTRGKKAVVKEFLSVADKVSTPVLIQLMGHFAGRNSGEERLVLPKGSIEKAIVLPAHEALDSSVVTEIIRGLRKVLVDRFSKLPAMGNVYLDEDLMDYSIPSQMRSTSRGLISIGRGSRFPLTPGKNVVRMFIYWVGRDIDLSTVLYDENFYPVGQVSYTNLRNNGSVVHSGDITRAPYGASEFIDVNVEALKKENPRARYLAMQVYVYSGPKFAQHETCYAGWMERADQNSGEIFEPATVKNKLDLQLHSKVAIPMILDVETRSIIAVDLPVEGARSTWGNNLHNNGATIQRMLKAFVNADNKLSLYELFNMHIEARGNAVDNITDADVAFTTSLDAKVDGHITPSDIETIHSQYIK